MADIKDISLLDVAPPNLTEDPECASLLQAMSGQFRRLAELTERVILLPNIDKQPSEIVDALEAIRNGEKGKPNVIVAKTVKGRGVSFMENVPSWHGVAPNDEEYAAAMAEVEGGLK